MKNSYIKMESFGLIGDDQLKGPYRIAVFKDTINRLSGELVVFQKERPMLWNDILKLELGGNVPPYRGEIVKYNTLHLVVFDNETIDEAFNRQKWKLNIKGRLNYSKAEEMRQETHGYRTNLSSEHGIEIGWRPVDSGAGLIKYRLLENKHSFSWTCWYEIKPDEKLL
jgi:hypothetical protein